MSSPFGDDILEDIPINDFQGATLRIDPASAQPSRSVSPNAPIGGIGDGTAKTRRFSELRQAISDPSDGLVSPPSPTSDRNFYSGLGRSFYQQPPIGKPRRASWHANTGPSASIEEFFSVRVGALDQALEDCRFLLDPELDGDIRGAWLLTEINHWDIEKERVVLLCDLSILVIKYDFIALHRISFNRIRLITLIKVEIGEVTYPDKSLVPHISGIAGGVVTVIRGVLFNRLSNTFARITSWKSSEPPPEIEDKEKQKPEGIPSQFNLSAVSFEPRGRNVQGCRITWNSRHILSFSQRWNPFCSNIPYTTFTSHPLYWYLGCENATYNVKSFSAELGQTLDRLQERPDIASDTTCSVTNAPIIVENYVGIASLLHNVSELGFFKYRGKGCEAGCVCIRGVGDRSLALEKKLGVFISQLYMHVRHMGMDEFVPIELEPS